MDFALASGREVLTATPAVLRAMLAPLSAGWVHAREDPSAWSARDVLCHLLHIDENDWIDRTRVILEHGTSQPFAPVDREAGISRFEGRSVPDLLERFAGVRASNVAALDTLVSTDALTDRGVHPDFGEVTLAQLLATWVAHDLNHLAQIVKTMAKEYRDAVGPWRAFLPILDAP